MLERALAPLLKDGQHRSLPRLKGYLDTLTVQEDHVLAQYQVGPYSETLSVELLERIIGMADIDALLSLGDSFAQYTHGIVPVLEEMNALFDPLQNTGKVTDFVGQKGSHICKEYVFPISTDDVFNDLPFGLGWDAWKGVTPLAIRFLPTSELTFYALGEQLHYQHDVPPFAMFTLDCASLVMKYLSYLSDRNVTRFRDDEKALLPQWLHQYVIYPTLIKDAVAFWMLGQYQRQILTLSPVSGSFQDYAWITATAGRIGSQYPQAIQDIVFLISQLEAGSITPNTFLSSLYLPHHTSVISKVKQFSKSSIAPYTQYRWGEYLALTGVLDIILGVLSLYPYKSENQNTVITLKRELHLFQMAHPWNNLSDKLLKDFIDTSIDRQLMLLNTLSP